MRTAPLASWWAALSAALVLSACCNGAECAGTCVDTDSDPANCGGCGIACSPAETCFFGHCVCVAPCGDTCPDVSSDPASCGACGHACPLGATCTAGACACPPGTTDCGDLCADLATDRRACGTCGTACAPEGACEGGECRCPEPQVACGASCVDLDFDDAHCGACDSPCPAPRACNSGACRCPNVGDEVCPDGCVSLSSDPWNCGRCGNLCAPELACVDGACACPGGRTHCGSTCTDLATDLGHCGACGRVCTRGSACLGGRCVPEHVFDARESATDGTDGLVAIDPEGNVVAAWSPRNGSVSLRRYDPAGTILWTRTFATYADRVSGLDVDATGRIALVAGFGSSWRSPGRTTVSSLGLGDVAVVLLSPDGSVVWERFVASTGQERGGNAAFESDGDLVVSGVLGGSIDTGVGVIYGASDRDAFVVTLSGVDGSYLSARDYGGFGTDDPVFLDVTPDGDRMIATKSGAGIDFGGGSLGGTTGVYVGRIGPAFEHRWSRRLTGVDEIDGVAAGPDGTTYVAGRAIASSTAELVDFGGGIGVSVPRNDTASFVVAYAPDGTALWAHGVSTSYGAAGGGVAVDGAGRVFHFFTYSWFTTSVPRDPPSFGASDVHLAAYDAAGLPLWQRSFGSGDGDVATDVAAAADRVAIAARAGTTIDLGGGSLPRMSYSDHVLAVFGL